MKQQAQQHFRTCNLCEAMCGLVMEVEDDQILSIKGDPADPLSKGHICPKALALKDFHEDPDRLREPVMKTEDGWQKISWSRAFELVATRIKGIQKDYGNDAVGLYLGNPNVHHHGNLLGAMLLEKTLKTRNRFSATSNDQLPHMRANYEMFGHQLLFPVPDIDHTDLFILLGSNPAASNGSLMAAPDYLGRLKAIRRRGGEVILIDPRRTETARVVDQHLFVKPGTDAFLLLAMIHTLFDEGLVETGRLTAHVDDIAQIQLISADFSAETVAPLTGIDAEQIKTLARKLANTPRAALFGRMGTSTQEFGALATWLIYVLNVLSNHLDERGGLMFAKPAAEMLEITKMIGWQGSHNTFQSKSGLPEFSGELPASTMAEQIELPGPGQIKAMIVIAGNPVSSSPNVHRLEKAFASLDFMVSVDAYVNETSRHADLILPPTSQLEQSHYDLALNMTSVRNVAKYSPPLFERDKRSRHDWEIMLELCRRLWPHTLTERAQSEAAYQVLKRMGPDGILDLILRAGPYGTQIPGTTKLGAFLIDAVQDLIGPAHPLRKLMDTGPYGAPNRSLSKGLCVASLRNYPHGIDLGSLQSCLPDRLYTPNKRIKLAPATYMQDLKRLRTRAEQLASDQRSPDEFLLIGRRDVRSNNSWMHNSQRLIKGKQRCTMLMHPDDAKALGLKEGELAEVSSRVGQIQIAVNISDSMMPGVISIPHGWGHQHEAIQLSIAKKQPGVNVNVLTDDSFVDRLSGTSALNGVPVTVIKAGSKGRRAKPASTTTKKPGTKKTATAQKSRVRVSAKLA
ncbi:MAG: molybdopterin oxidoreductase family protein [Oleiphilaceae bacterium]|nr:molybdopterin oxidoreductase family protein [Oleiphilaceae bacterium]